MKRHFLRLIVVLSTGVCAGAALLWGLSHVYFFNARLIERSEGNHFCSTDCFVWNGDLGYSDIDCTAEVAMPKSNPPRVLIAKTPVTSVSLALDDLAFDDGVMRFAGIAFYGSYRHVHAMLIPIWMVALLFAIAPAGTLLIRRRGRRREKAGLCVACGYDLTGNTSGVCPECGAPTSNTA